MDREREREGKKINEKKKNGKVNQREGREKKKKKKKKKKKRGSKKEKREKNLNSFVNPIQKLANLRVQMSFYPFLGIKY